MIKTLSIGLSIVDAVLSAVVSEAGEKTSAEGGEKTEGQTETEAKARKKEPEVIEGYDEILEVLSRTE